MRFYLSTDRNITGSDYYLGGLVFSTLSTWSSRSASLIRSKTLARRCGSHAAAAGGSKIVGGSVSRSAGVTADQSEPRKWVSCIP